MLNITAIIFLFNSLLPQQQQGSITASLSTAGKPLVVIQKERMPDSLLIHRAAIQKEWRLKSPVAVVKTMTKSMPAENDYEPIHKSQHQSWLFYIMLVLLAFIAFVRVNSAKELDELFSIFKPIGINQQLFRDALSGLRISSVLLNINLVVVIGMYAYLLSRFFHWKDTDWRFLCLLSGVAAVVLVGRYGLIRVAAYLFPFGKEISFYHFNELQINRITGLLLLPLVMLIAFSPYPVSYYAMLASFVLIVSMLLFRYIRGFAIGQEYFTRNKFHFLLYICTLEIAPIVIFVKFLKEWAA